MNPFDFLTVAALLGAVVTAFGVLGYLLSRNRAMIEERDNQISEFKRVREEIESFASRLKRERQALGDVAFDALFLVDTEHRVGMMSAAAHETFPRATAEGETLMAVTRSHEIDAVIRDVLESGDACESVVNLQDKLYRVRAIPIDTQNTPHVAVALRDITELKRLEVARRDMVANISHELRNPITSIRILVDTLSHDMARDPVRDKRLLDRIAHETHTLQHMTQELLDLSMIESGQAILRLVPMSLAEIVEEAERQLQEQLNLKHISFSYSVPADLRVLIDPDQVRRVLVNLMHNAIKFTPLEGSIHVGVEEYDADFYKVWMEDTGPGVPIHERGRIFERFYQVDTARKKGGGTGLGLAIAKHIIEAHGGEIWVEDADPHGAKFCLTLPDAGS